MKLNHLLLAFICLYSLSSCNTRQDNSVCEQLQNQYWLDLDTTAIYISFFEHDTVSIFSSEVGFMQLYTKCENNILFSSYKKELTDIISSERLSFKEDTLIMEAIERVYISKMKRITKEEADLILSPYLPAGTTKEFMTIEPPRINQEKPQQ